VDVELVEVGVESVTDDIIVKILEEGAVADYEDVGVIWLLGLDAVESELGAVESGLHGFAVA
jgi:hypothetical protein